MSNLKSGSLSDRIQQTLKVFLKLSIFNEITKVFETILASDADLQVMQYHYNLDRRNYFTDTTREALIRILVKCYFESSR